MKNKRVRRAPTHSIIWRIHGSWLLKILFLFLIIDGIIFVLLAGIDIEYLTPELALEIRARMNPLLGFETVYFIYTLLFGSSKLHRIMSPLTRLTETARVLSQEKLDDEVYHQLENAINRISPRSDETVHTGNNELQGLEAAVNSLLERMRQTYAQQARFVSDASHELRTPIAVIQGYANMLDRWGKSDPKVLDEAIGAIKSESRHMQELIEQLLFLARSDSGRNKLIFEEFSASDMVKETFSEYRMITPDRNWLIDCPDDDIKIVGDEGMLKQTLRILCDNAVKYSSPGSDIRLSLREDGGTVRFSVQDEGLGISPEDQGHIFERFYRADLSRDRQTGGNGLGLSIAAWIIERHGGKIEVLSRLGIGTRMTVVLRK